MQTDRLQQRRLAPLQNRTNCSPNRLYKGLIEVGDRIVVQVDMAT
jgi:hypothetical protein